MKKTIFTAFSILLLATAFSQSAVNDALELSRLSKKYKNNFAALSSTDATSQMKADMEVLSMILGRYYVHHTDNFPPTINDILESYHENVFFDKYVLPEGVNMLASEEMKSLDFGFRLPFVPRKVSSSGTGLNVAMLADGVAKFLVKRTKEELTVAFFEEFRQTLAENHNLGVLFPASRLILMGIGDQVYNYNTYLNSMRDAFITDLKRLHDNLETLMVQVDKRMLKDTMPVYYLADLFAISRMLIEEARVDEVIKYLGHDAHFQILPIADDSKAFSNFKAALKMLHIVSSVLESGDGSARVYVTPLQFKNLIKDKTATDFYMGFIYEQAKSLDNLTLPFRDSFTYAKIDRYVNILSSVVDLGDRLYNIKADLDSGNYNTSDTFLHFQYFDYLQVALDLIGTAQKFTTSMFPGDVQLVNELNRVNFVTGRISNIALDVRRRHYAKAVINAGLLTNELLLHSEDISCQLMRYGAFMASVAESRNSDDVAAVMETFALPRGSAFIKKHYPFNMSIGAYVGLNASVEMLDKVSKEDKTGLNVGVSAPIGIAFSWPMSKEKGKSPGSFSFFLSIMDIGAFTAYRFTNNESVNDLPALKFDNIFAPGAALVFGFPKFPGAFSLFGQRGPSLRKVTGTAYEFSETNGWRIGISLSVDIPLFNLYTKGKDSGCSYAY